MKADLSSLADSHETPVKLSFFGLPRLGVAGPPDIEEQIGLRVASYSTSRPPKPQPFKSGQPPEMTSIWIFC
jgi:hypothetical protein